MARHAPVLIVTVNGKPVSGLFYSRVVTASVRDEKGQTSDTCSFKLDDANNALEVPAKGAMLNVLAGYRGGGLVDKGTFKLEQPEITGGDDGEFIILTGKGGDLKKKLKGDGAESYEKKTFGEIVRSVAGKAGLQAVVDPDLDKIKFEYKARASQSEIDFLTRLADEVGGIVKPAGNKLIVAKRGKGTSASGQPLPPVILMRSEAESWRFKPDGRTQYKRIGAHWIDQKTGKRKTEWVETGLKGTDHILREVAQDQARAKQAAESEKQRLNNATGEGSVTLAGLESASAGADVITIGFRPECNGGWRCSAVQDDWDKNSGWRTTVEFEAKEDGSKGGYKDEEE